MALLLAKAAVAQTESHFDDWGTLQIPPDALFAAVSDQFQRQFGKVCYTQQHVCNWFVINVPDCKADAQVTVKLSSDKATVKTQATCSMKSNPPSLTFQNPAIVEQVLRNANTLTVAWPTTSRQGVTTQFSLRGMAAALAHIEPVLPPPSQVPQQPPPPDCGLLQSQYFGCKRQYEDAYKRCMVSPRPGNCTSGIPQCFLPSQYDRRCSP
jgi:hypothetical protein